MVAVLVNVAEDSVNELIELVTVVLVGRHGMHAPHEIHPHLPAHGSMFVKHQSLHSSVEVDVVVRVRVVVDVAVIVVGVYVGLQTEQAPHPNHPHFVAQGFELVGQKLEHNKVVLDVSVLEVSDRVVKDREVQVVNTVVLVGKHGKQAPQEIITHFSTQLALLASQSLSQKNVIVEVSEPVVTLEVCVELEVIVLVGRHG